MNATDALGQDINVGDCVVYIQKRRGGDTLAKGVVVKVNKARHGVQPLSTRQVNQQHTHLYQSHNLVSKDGVYFEYPADIYNVEGHRFVVVDGKQWKEYQQFIRNNWLLGPLDSFV